MFNYIILGSHTDYCRVMCKDVLDKNNVYFENNRDYVPGCVLKFLRRVHLSKKINRMAVLPFKNLWYPYYLNESKISKKANNVFILFDSNSHVYDEAYLIYLKNKFNGNLVLLLVNKISAIESHDVNYFNNVYDYIFTTDITDAKTYNYHFIPGIYSKTQIYEGGSLNLDLFFIGANKGRLGTLHEIAHKINKYDINYSINIIDVQEADKLLDANISYNNRMDYSEVLRYAQSSNCLLEVVQEGQSGLTLRAIEAFVYNKKLLTNNDWIKESELYNPKYVQIYNKVEDIDVHIIEEKLDVDFKYNNQYSPLRLFEKIEQLLE